MNDTWSAAGHCTVKCSSRRGFDVTFERAGCLTRLAVMALQVEAFAKDFPTIGFEKASMRYKD